MALFSRLVLFAFLLITICVDICSGAQCSELATEGLCTNNAACEWVTGACQCGNTAPIDLVLLIDSSGSMSSADWAAETNFTATVIESGLADDTVIEVIQFASDAEVIWAFDDDQTDRSAIAAAVRNADQNFGGTHMRRGCYDSWYAFYDLHGYDPVQQRIFIFMTDGNPSYESWGPCYGSDTYRTYFDWLDVKTYVILIGDDVDEQYVTCLPDDPDNDIIRTDGKTGAAFNAIFGATEDILCPDTLSLKVTEVRIEDYATASHSARFVEFYVNSATFSLASNDLIFDGFLTSAQFGYGANSNCAYDLTEYTYVVIYDNSGSAPECPSCNCTTSGDVGTLTNLQCSNALFIPCDGTSSTSGCGTCTWDTITMSNDEWSQSVSDYSSNEVLSEATRPSGSADWVGVYEGWSSEVTDLSISSSESYIWAQSCNYTGTPGAAPLKRCGITCSDSLCQANGDTGASCNLVHDMCNCTGSAFYYGSTTSVACLLLDAPLECYVENTFNVLSSGTARFASVIWDTGSGYSVDGVKFAVTGTVNGETLEADTDNSYLFLATEVLTTDTVQVAAYYQDSLNGKVSTDTVDCDILTVDPTSEPTPSPTTSIPDIASCTGYITGYDMITITWDEAVADSESDIEDDFTYYVWGDYGNEEFSAQDISLIMVLRPDPDLDIENNGWPVISVAALIYDEDGNEDFARMEADGSTLCTLTSSEPTESPTAKPTAAPTQTPSDDPTVQPTARPTYADWTIRECSVTFPGGTVAPIEVGVNVEYDVGGSSATAYFYVDGDEKDYFAVSTGNTNTYSLVTFVSSVPDPEWTYEMKLVYQEYPGSSVSTDTITCEYTTVSPTPAPTDSPSKEPTPQPTDKPSTDPTKSPSDQPTKSPTYRKLTLDSECTYELNQGNTLVEVKFTEAYYTNADDEDPKKNDIYYNLEWLDSDGVSQTVTVQARGSLDERTSSNNNAGTDGYDTDVDNHVTIEIGDDLGDSPITCSRITQAPTNAPITDPPTNAPTDSDPEVYLDLVSGESNWNFDKDCDIPYATPSPTALPIEARRRLADTPTPYPTSDYLDIATCYVLEDNTKKYVYLKRSPSNFEYDLIIGYRVIYEGTLASEDFDHIASSAEVFVEPQTVYYGYIFGANSGYDNELEIEYRVNEKDASNEGDESFIFEIVSCEVDTDAGAVTTVPVAEQNAYSCSKDDDKWAVRIIITEPAEGASSITTQGDMPVWVWYPIAAAGLAIPIALYLIWRFYNAKKAADAMEIVRKHELREEIKQDDVGDFGVAGDIVQANPLATGDAFALPTTSAMIEHQLETEINQFETAQVEVVANVFRQDFGPVQAEKH